LPRKQVAINEGGGHRVQCHTHVALLDWEGLNYKLVWGNAADI
jgi:hypothetical protein